VVEVAIVGASKSGKTTVIEGLVDYLVRAGYRVGTVKHTAHSHRFDTPGKDSYRHRQAGALLTIAVSDEEVALFAKPELMAFRQLQDMTDQQIDIWIIEGERRADRPKILVTRHLEKLSDGMPENIVATIGPERPGEVSPHFEMDDYAGLGSFVTTTALVEKKESRR
jgi:molybdopterin-guanine dinucleotide biosynthesis protein B